MLQPRYVLRLILLSALLLAGCGKAETPAPPTQDAGEPAAEAPRLSGRRSAATVVKRSDPPLPLVPDESPLRDRRRGAEILVLDEYGAPMPGAEVVHGSTTHRTDEHGRTALAPFVGGHGMPSQYRREKTILVRVPGYVPVEHLCGDGGGDLEQVQLGERGVSIAGRCVDARGEPLPELTLNLDYRDMPRFVLETDADGCFSIDQAPRREATLRVAARGWTSRWLPVVPPVEDLQVVAHKTAWLRGRFDETYEKGHWHAWRIELWTNQGWTAKLDPTKPFAIPCCPGEVVVSWPQGELGRFVLEEGEVIDDVVLPIDTTSRSARSDGPPAPPPPGWIDVDLRGMGGDSIALVAFFADRPPQALGRKDVGEVVRVPLLSKEARWLAVEPYGCAWRQPIRSGQQVRIERPPLGRFSLRLLDREGEAVNHGTISIRWAGTRHGATYASHSDHSEPSPPHARDDAPLIPGAFVSRGLGPGVYDLVWRSGYYAHPVLLARRLEMPDPVGVVELGTFTLPGPQAIHVRVLDTQGKPVSGAVVRMLRGRDVRAVRTGADGEVRIPAPDPTDLLVSVDAGESGRAEVRLPNDATREIVTIRIGP